MSELATFQIQTQNKEGAAYHESGVIFLVNSVFNLNSYILPIKKRQIFARVNLLKRPL